MRLLHEENSTSEIQPPWRYPEFRRTAVWCVVGLLGILVMIVPGMPWSLWLPASSGLMVVGLVNMMRNYLAWALAECPDWGEDRSPAS